MKILITGCRGFLGGTVARRATSVGHHVFGVSRAAQPPHAWQGEYLAADVVTADLAPAIRRFQPDAIVHAAGTASVGDSFAAPMGDLRASLLSWANLLDSVRRAALHPLILFPSSGAVYGRLENLPVKEDAALSPISPYGFHKVACELIAREYSLCFDQRTIVCRLFSILGEAQRRLLVWELFQKFTGAEDTVWLEGTGNETRDYLYADDVTDGMVRLIESQARDMTTGGHLPINLASGNETRVRDLATEIGKLIASKKEVRCRGITRSGDPQRWQADISLFCSLVPEWKPRSLHDGLTSCIAAWQRELQLH